MLLFTTMPNGISVLSSLTRNIGWGGLCWIDIIKTQSTCYINKAKSSQQKSFTDKLLFIQSTSIIRSIYYVLKNVILRMSVQNVMNKKSTYKWDYLSFNFSIKIF